MQTTLRAMLRRLSHHINQAVGFEVERLKKNKFCGHREVANCGQDSPMRKGSAQNFPMRSARGRACGMYKCNNYRTSATAHFCNAHEMEKISVERWIGEINLSGKSTASLREILNAEDITEIDDLMDMSEDELSSLDLNGRVLKKLRLALHKLGNDQVLKSVNDGQRQSIAGTSSMLIHITYSREDSELLVRIQDAARMAKWDVSGVMSNQGNEWFEAWLTALKKSLAVCVIFTEGDSKALNNQGIGYKEKFTARMQAQGNDAALYKEAMAILAVKKERPGFKIYVLDGINHTPEQLAFNLMKDAPSFGPVDKWIAFVEGGWRAHGGSMASQGDSPTALNSPEMDKVTLKSDLQCMSPGPKKRVAQYLVEAGDHTQLRDGKNIGTILEVEEFFGSAPRSSQKMQPLEQMTWTSVTEQFKKELKGGLFGERPIELGSLLDGVLQVDDKANHGHCEGGLKSKRGAIATYVNFSGLSSIWQYESGKEVCVEEGLACDMEWGGTCTCRPRTIKFKFICGQLVAFKRSDGNFYLGRIQSNSQGKRVTEWDARDVTEWLSDMNLDCVKSIASTLEGRDGQVLLQCRELLEDQLSKADMNQLTRAVEKLGAN
jgi:hypothetical protein